MKIDIEIFPYKISQRTEYSKIIVYDMIQNKSITGENDDIINRIIDDYYKQLYHKEEFFEIKNNHLVSLKPAFKEEDIKYLFIPDSVSEICNNVFCENAFELVHIPNTIKKIPEYCFSGCYKLKYVNIPDTVKQIENYAFYGCTSLEEVILPNISTLKYGLFANCISLKKINIPESVRYLESFAFKDCEALREIKLPDNIKSLPDGLFNYCHNLEKVILPNKLKIIGAQCFRWCNQLKEITIPDSVEIILDCAFMNCEGLKCVKLSKNLQSINNNAFCGCINLTDITLSDSINKLIGKTFGFTSKLTSINVPKNLNFITDGPFRQSKLKTLIFNHDLKELEMNYDYFNYDLITETKVTKLVIDSSVKVITPDAFKFSGNKIKEIEYLGTKDQFTNFKKNNKKLFNNIGEVSITFVKKSIEEKNIEYLSY